MTSSIFRFSSNNLLINPSHCFQFLSKSTASQCSFNKHSNFRDQPSISKRMKIQKSRRLTVHSQPPGVPLNSEPPSSSWKSWILAIVVTVALPFLSSRWGSLLKLKNKVETTTETAEHVANVVEKVAEEVDKVAEAITEELPEAGNLRNTMAVVEKVAEEVDKDAHLVGDFIEKVEQVEKTVDSFLESSMGEAKETAAEIKKGKL